MNLNNLFFTPEFIQLTKDSLKFIVGISFLGTTIEYVKYKYSRFYKYKDGEIEIILDRKDKDDIKEYLIYNKRKIN